MLKHLNEFDQNNQYTNPFQKESLFMLFRRALELVKAKLVRDGVFGDIKVDDLQLFIHFRMLSPEEAFQVLQTKGENEHKRFMDLIPDLVSLVLRSPEKGEDENVKALVARSVAYCKKQILDNNQVKVIMGISSLLKMPSTCYEEDRQLVIKSLKDYLPLVNMRLYRKLIASIANQNFKGAFQFRQQIIKEVFGLLNHFLDKARKEEFFSLLQELVRLDVKSAFYFNQMLVYYGNNFDAIHPNEKIELLSLFSQLKINQSDIYNQTIESVFSAKNTHQ